MVDEEILELRRKLDESIANENNYEKTYKLSIELDELITKYYNRKLKITPSTDIWNKIASEWGCIKASSFFSILMCPKYYKNIIF